ncbi:MAG TPA: hypothetical protein DD424_10615 [Porphyromonadaceae bacterium]|nr:hypothetical protein [Porphyromonadaceae bacterium]
MELLNSAKHKSIYMSKSNYIGILIVSIILLVYPVYTLIINSEWTSVVFIFLLIIIGSIGTYRACRSINSNKSNNNDRLDS